jgi:uncharacterized membrane protein YccC
MTEGIIIGIVVTVGATLVIALAAALIRLWRSPKRLDRLEAVVPAMARGIMLLLRSHQAAGKAKKEVQDALDELQKLTTDMMVSQRGGGVRRSN